VSLQAVLRGRLRGDIQANAKQLSGGNLLVRIHFIIVMIRWTGHVQAVLRARLRGYIQANAKQLSGGNLEAETPLSLSSSLPF